MKRIRIVVAVATAIMLIAAVPAMACGHQRMNATYDGMTVGFDPDPTAVAERCPEGFQWILQSAGTIELRTSVYEGTAALASEHCSRWVTPPGERALGEVGAGMMTFATPDGDELWMAYHGRFKFKGDVTVGWVSRVKGHYVVLGGSGIFEGAGGSGFMRLVDETNIQSGKVFGTLTFDG